jgi:hypothetical protein
MDVTAASPPTDHGPESQPLFGTAQLFLTDSRLVGGVLNSARYVFLRRAFGISREQANIVTFMGTLVAAEMAYGAARRVMRAPLHTSRADAALGGAALREVAFAIGGPRSREVRGYATLVSAALLISVAFPGLRHTARRVREAESRVRHARIDRYSDAIRSGQQ